MKVRHSLMNSMRMPRLVSFCTRRVQVVEVARQAIHAVHYHSVALAHEGQQRIQFRPLGVLARRFIGEYLVHPNLFELAFRVLVEAADPDIADTLTVQGCRLRKVLGRNL